MRYNKYLLFAFKPESCVKRRRLYAPWVRSTGRRWLNNYLNKIWTPAKSEKARAEAEGGRVVDDTQTPAGFTNRLTSATSQHTLKCGARRRRADLWRLLKEVSEGFSTCQCIHRFEEYQEVPAHVSAFRTLKNTRRFQHISVHSGL